MDTRTTEATARLADATVRLKRIREALRRSSRLAGPHAHDLANALAVVMSLHAVLLEGPDDELLSDVDVALARARELSAFAVALI